MSRISYRMPICYEPMSPEHYSKDYIYLYCLGILYKDNPKTVG